MLNLALSDEEKTVLIDLLESSIPTLDVEIHRTDNLEYKENLTRRRRMLSGLLGKIAEPSRMPPSPAKTF